MLGSVFRLVKESLLEFSGTLGRKLTKFLGEEPIHVYCVSSAQGTGQSGRQILKEPFLDFKLTERESD